MMFAPLQKTKLEEAVKSMTADGNTLARDGMLNASQMYVFAQMILLTVQVNEDHVNHKRQMQTLDSNAQWMVMLN